MKKTSNPYQCLSCNGVFKFKDRKIIQRNVYGIMINENACPYCGSLEMTNISYNDQLTDRYITQDINNDQRFFTYADHKNRKEYV